MDEPLEPHPGIRFSICPQSGAVSTTTAPLPTTTHHRRSSLLVPDHILRTLRERSRDSYQKIKDLPTVLSSPFQYAPTPAVPLIQTINTLATSKNRLMDESICEGPVVACGPGGRSAAGQSLNCLGTRGAGSCVDDLKTRAKHLLENLHSKHHTPAERPSELTLRIKNNRSGHCIFLVTPAPNGNGTETLTPVDSLKPLFPLSKTLRSALTAWNRHYQNPPQHWIINFIPRAYLRRGQFLAEEVCAYLEMYRDGCRYRIEYEPIGHEPSLVGSVGPRTLKPRARYRGERGEREREVGEREGERERERERREVGG